MSDEARTWAKKVAGIKIAEKSVLNALAGYADADGKAWPKVSTLATVTSMSGRHVIRIINRLTEKGLLRREPRWREAGGNTSNTYWLAMPEEELVGERSDTGVSASVTKRSDTGVSALVTNRSDRCHPVGDNCVTPNRTSLDSSLSEESSKRTRWREKGGVDIEASARTACAADDPDVAKGSARKWVGVPPEVRDSLVAIPQLGEGWCRSWIDPCGWHADKRELIPRTHFARGRIVHDIGSRRLCELQLGVGEPQGRPQ